MFGVTLIKQSKEDITLEAGSVDASKGRQRTVFGKGVEGFGVLTTFSYLNWEITTQVLVYTKFINLYIYVLCLLKCILYYTIFLKCFNKTTTQEDVIYASGLLTMVLTDLEQEPNQNFQEQFPLFKNTIYKEFPGCLVVRIPGFHCYAWPRLYP